jgi:hypothetical protein
MLHPDHPDDRLELDEATWEEAELLAAYTEIDRVSAIAEALYVGVCGLIEALTPLPEVPGLSPVAVEHLRLALREARNAMQMADTFLEECADGH